MTARGLRNANPGNIRHSSTTWQGQAAEQPDPAFVTFKSPTWGIRAIAKILLTYQAKGLETVRQMILRWAPPTENDTEAYIRSVALHMGVDPDQEISFQGRPDLMLSMVEAIIRHENGSQPYSAAELKAGLLLAGVGVTDRKTA
jgi:hypothetical protein